MGKIFYIMGKSASGKDTIFRELKERCPQLGMVVPYTTRPIRAGEKNGVEYFFTDEAALAKMEAEHKIIEIRSYDTVHGIWKYFTAADGQIDLESSDYLMIGTLESYRKMREYYGEEHLIPLYIEVEGRSFGNSSRHSLNTKKCADASWQTKRIFQKRT